ncbi:MAG: DUF4251 domain-containing protein [Carboxylicivirga sp.]|jgi:hypothetical protein|nr:DUF4251 domain-containing protein [Carboxylicivirga sp.]
MKRILALSLVLSMTLAVFGQQDEEKKLTRKERREIQKQEQKALSEQQAKVLALAIDKKHWVLEANTLSNKRGSTVNVNSTLNFIAVEGEEAFVQLGSNSGMGQNGVGGVSVRGKVTKYEVKKNEKKGTYFITVYVTSALGSFDIRLDSNPDGQIANATVQGNRSSRVQYRGIIVPIPQSSVYKGTPVI